MNLWGRIRLPFSLPSFVRDRFSPVYLVIFGGLWLFFFFVAPWLLLVSESLQLFTDPTLKHYETATAGVYLDTMIRTFYYALISTVVNLVLGYIVAYYAAFKAKRPVLILALIAIPLWIAIVIRYFGTALLFLPTGPVVEIFGTDFGIMFDTPGVIIALVTVLLPFAILPIYNALDSMDEDMISASHVLGASRLRTFYEVTLPQSLSGIVAATIFIFILSSGSFLAPAILGGPGNFMMANVIASSYAFNIELAAAMSVVFTLALLVIIIAFNSYISIGKVLGEL